MNLEFSWVSIQCRRWKSLHISPDPCLKLCLILFSSSINAPDTCLKLCLHFMYFLNEHPRPMPHFIYFLNKCPRHMPQIVPIFYLFPPWTPRTHASNCDYFLFISSINAPNPCLKLCQYLIYFLNKRPRHMPQGTVCLYFYLFLPWTPWIHASNCDYFWFISSINAPDTCLKLCLHFIYIPHERFRYMPQTGPMFYLFPRYTWLT